MNRLWTIMRKELYHIWRDPRTLAMILALPALLLVLLGYGISGESRDTTLAVVDYSKSDASRDYINRFTASDDFEVVYDVLSEAALINLIDRDLIDVGILIPEDFARQLMSGQQATAQIYIDGSMNPTDSLTVQLKLNAISSMAAQDILVERVERAGLASGLTLPITGILKTLYNPNGNNKLYMIPGLIPILLQVQTLLLSALAIVREREQGTMEQLISTPVKGPELILGKLLPYFAVGMFDVLLAVLMGEFLFDVPLRGNVPLLFGVSAAFLVGALALGMVISIVAKSQLLASQLAMILTFLPSFLLSGFMYDIGNMPRPVQIVTYLIPARYFVALLKGIYLKGVGLEVLGVEAALLVVFGGAMVVLANVKFKKRLNSATSLKG